MSNGARFAILVGVSAERAVAVACAVAAAFFYALSNVLQQHEAEQVAEADTLKLGLLTRLVRRPRWVVGMGADVGGYGFEALALGIGTLVLVEPILSTSLLLSLFLGRVITKRRISRAGWHCRRGPGSRSCGGEAAAALIVGLKAQLGNELLRKSVATPEIFVPDIDGKLDEVVHEPLLAPSEVAHLVGRKVGHFGLLRADVVDEGVEQASCRGFDAITLPIGCGRLELAGQGQEGFVAEWRRVHRFSLAPNFSLA